MDKQKPAFFEISDDIGQFFVEYVTAKFDCDGLAIFLVDSGPKPVLRPLLQYAAQTLVCDDILQAVAHNVSVSTADRRCLRIMAGKPAAAVPGREPAGTALIYGRADAQRAYVAVILKAGASPQGLARFVAGQLDNPSQFQVLMRVLLERQQLHERLTALEWGFDSMQFGSLLVDQNGQILHINSYARSFLQDAFGQINHDINLTHPSAMRFIASLLSSFHLQRKTHQGECMPVVTLWRKLPGAISQIPIFLKEREMKGGAKTFCIFIPNASEPAEPSELLCGLGLTNAEAKLAARIILGQSLSSASQELRITTETGRTYLKRVFAKLGVSRQAELVSIFARYCPPIFPPRQHGMLKI